MAAKKNLFFDKTEFVTTVPTGRGKTKIVNVVYDQVNSINIEKCVARKLLFITSPSEKITVFVRNLADPIVVEKSKSGPFYDEYKKNFIDFAANNKISLRNNTNE